MKRALIPSLVWLCGVMIAAAQLPTIEPPRGWKTAEGQAFQASVMSYDGTTVIFRAPNGSQAPFPAARLSPDDKAYLVEWQKKQPIKINLPTEVGVETSEVKAEVVSEDPAADKFVYRTQHFEFESQGKFTQSLLRDVARNFEATYELVKALPWGILPEPESGDHFKARLLKNKDEYHSAGGPVNSGGVYMGSKSLFMVPFESIGVKLVGKSYTKDEDFKTHTMVHELTHQMMHGSLRYLPQWVVEGTAEYTGTLPLKTGKFRLSAAKNGLKDYLEYLKKDTRDGVPEPYSLEKLFPITNEEWNRTLEENPRASHQLYFTSYLLVYYFMHLDEKGDGQLFARYFREIASARDDIEKHRKGMDADFQKKTLAILLNGRTSEELMKQIRSAYARLGVRL